MPDEKAQAVPAEGSARLLTEAERALERGDFSRARILAKQALERLPEDPEAGAEQRRRAEAILQATGPDRVVVALGVFVLVVVLAAFLAAV